MSRQRKAFKKRKELYFHLGANTINPNAKLW